MVEERNESDDFQPQCRACGGYLNKLLLVLQYPHKTKIQFSCDSCGQINFLNLEEVITSNGNKKKECGYAG